VQSHAPCVIAAILVPSHATFIMATAIATTEYKIFLLQGKDDYPSWLIDIRAVLRRNGLWQFAQSDGVTACASEVDRLLKEPPKNNTPHDKATIEQRVNREWEANTEKAADAITLTLHTKVKSKLHEEDFNNGYKMLTHLKQLFEPSTDTEFFMLMRELFDTKFDSFDTTDAYLTHIRTVNDKISRTKVELTAEKRALLCLTMTLPQNFETLVQMWSLKPPTFDECCTAIADFQRRSDDKHVAQSFTNTTTYPRHYKVFPRDHCRNCPKAKKPHLPQDCWKTYPEKRPDWAKKQDFTTTNTATTGILNAMAAAHISPTETTPFHF
jgi:hypothetical protein